jgi:hypothetical protein
MYADQQVKENAFSRVTIVFIFVFGLAGCFFWHCFVSIAMSWQIIALRLSLFSKRLATMLWLRFSFMTKMT